MKRSINNTDVLMKGISNRIVRYIAKGGWWNIEKAGRCHQWKCELRRG